MSRIKIEKSSAEQELLMNEYRDKWIKIGLSTEPANREKAEEAVNKLYILAGLNPPKKIVWCGSPMSQGLARAIILDKKIINNIGDSVRDSVRDSVGASVRDSVRDSVGASVRDSVRDSVRESVRDSVWDSVGDSVWASVWESVRASVGDSVWASVRASVWASVGASVRASVRDSVWDSVRASVWESGYGQHDANWLAFYEYSRDVCNLKEETNKLEGLIDLAKNAGWFLPHENICFVSERHSILNRDDQGRLHSLSEAAVLYPDGWAIYAVHGVRVPEYIIKNPEKITIEKIESEENAEIKRVMVDIFGLDKYIQNCGAKLIHKDNLGELYKKEQSNDEDMLIVKVINSTAEPDGTFKNYFLRVHPECRPLLENNETGNAQELTATNAIASTFGMYGHEYKLQIET
jgi:hypothetical protein